MLYLDERVLRRISVIAWTQSHDLWFVVWARDPLLDLLRVSPKIPAHLDMITQNVAQRKLLWVAFSLPQDLPQT